ncbi:MAG: glycoside hydrolase family 3 N-terminal domain-containing protein [Acidimicrobiales bacterium]
MTERFDVPALLAELTLEEKASLVSGSGFWWTRRIERLGIGSIMVSDGPHGLRKQDRSADHVGIGGSVPATCFPTASALGSTWDRDLVREVGEAIGAEARAQGLAVVLGPGVNLKRDPRCGRNFEYLSEDPLVAGELGAAMVQGIQSQGVGTSLKHYAANNQETDRQRVSADIDDRTLRELYLSNFERVVRDAAPWTVMCSYNRINGTYASQDPWLLTEVLRDEWGFDGLVVSDWGAVDDPVAAVAAGLDLEMPSTGGERPHHRRRRPGRSARRGRPRHRHRPAAAADRAGDAGPRGRRRWRTTLTTPSPGGPPPTASCSCGTTTTSCRSSSRPAASPSSAPSPRGPASRAPGARR